MYSAQIKALKYTYKHTNYLQACKLIGTQYNASKCTPAQCTPAHVFVPWDAGASIYIEYSY